jgi:hypothetical protein
MVVIHIGVKPRGRVKAKGLGPACYSTAATSKD